MHVCTYLNVFLIVSPNIVLKFTNFHILSHFRDKFTYLACRLLMTAAWKVFKCKQYVTDNQNNDSFTEQIIYLDMQSER